MSDPSSGTSLKDSFFLSTSGWTDDLTDVPFQYVFNYFDNNTLSAVLLRGQGKYQAISPWLFVLFS